MVQLLRKIAFPFSLIYALVVHVRNFLYNIGVFASKSYRTPTICVGNLSVGGTGKTPMIEYLIRVLDGHKVAVLSRGYKRKSEGFLLADSNSSVLDLGDEPFQIHQKFPEVSVAVDADRRNGMVQLESQVQPQVVLLDDAFQHRRVKPKYSILLTAHGNLFVDDWYLPTGNLRDAKREYKRADMLIVTKCPDVLSKDDRRTISKKLKPLPHQNVLFSTLTYGDLVKQRNGDGLVLDVLKGKRLALVTGIASPGPLVHHLASKGLVFEHVEFGDHHHFTDDEINTFKDFELILTTEKDYVRLEGRVENLYYLEVAHSFDAEDRTLLEKAVKGLF
ncbi:MAG: tetraacyldisaccharide 4'-kinase [Flavobacteriaceae bacterium]|uniref:tetraacyldisaccharide 4'-kinase n=1 Tax=Flagellimonas TaxID=444459 RepID=UPI003BAABF74|nr:tetraacyldisaccharide 4'-kinase [Flavobacteriaceae bacterium]